MEGRIANQQQAPAPRSRRDQPRAFEARRVAEALADNTKLLLAVALLGLFGGALVARFAVPLDYSARTLIRVESHGVVASLPWAESDRVLETARVLSNEAEPVSALRKRIDVAPMGATRLAITAHAQDDEAAVSLADAVGTAFVSEVLRRTAEEQARERANRQSELVAAQVERERADGDLSRALNLEGVSDLESTLSQARARLADLEGRIKDARANGAAAETRGAVMQGASQTPNAKASSQALAEAQRSLSTLLTVHEPNHPEVVALRDRIRRLQASAVAPGNLAAGNRAQARGELARAAQLERDASAQREVIVKLSDVAQRLSPLLAARDHARQRIAEVERASSVAARAPIGADVQQRAAVVRVDNRVARGLAALLSPLLALLLAAAMIIAAEVRDFRICATTELSHWIQAPVVARSEWPGRADRLEVLIDELAELALDAPGTTLVLPLTELERPLALTLASQLNGRAQRHFRTATGARVTIAQAWEGEPTGPRVKRAAEVADRVLWVVSADTYTGAEITLRRQAITRSTGIAAVLLDAGEHGVASRIGDASKFWSARSEADEAARSVPPPRVPLH